MDYRLDASGAGIVVGLTGELTFTDNGKFRNLLEDIKEKKPDSCVIDLADLTFMDSAGLGMLILLKDLADDINCSLSLRGPKGQVEKILRISRFQEEIPIEQ